MKTYRPETLPQTLTVTVTAEDIAKGRPKRPCECPIARALSRSYPVTWGLYRSQCWGVDPAEACAYADTQIPVDYLMSKAAGDFVRAFDDGNPVTPATFRLRRAS